MGISQSRTLLCGRPVLQIYYIGYLRPKVFVYKPKTLNRDSQTAPWGFFNRNHAGPGTSFGLICRGDSACFCRFNWFIWLQNGICLPVEKKGNLFMTPSFKLVVCFTICFLVLKCSSFYQEIFSLQILNWIYLW